MVWLFFNNENGYPINVKQLITPQTPVYYNAGQWAEPDTEHLAYLMKNVYENYKETKEKALKNSEEIRKKWTWKNTAKNIKNRLCEIYSNIYSKKQNI